MVHEDGNLTPMEGAGGGGQSQWQENDPTLRDQDVIDVTKGDKTQTVQQQEKKRQEIERETADQRIAVNQNNDQRVEDKDSTTLDQAQAQAQVQAQAQLQAQFQKQLQEQWQAQLQYQQQLQAQWQKQWQDQWQAQLQLQAQMQRQWQELMTRLVAVLVRIGGSGS